MINPLSPKERARLACLAFARLDAHEVEPDQRVEWAAYQGVLMAAGIDPRTLESDGKRYDAEDVLARWMEPNAASWDYLRAHVPCFPRYTVRNPIYALNLALRGMFGLRHFSKQRTRHYKVDLELLEQQKKLIEAAEQRKKQRNNEVEHGR